MAIGNGKGWKVAQRNVEMKWAGSTTTLALALPLAFERLGDGETSADSRKAFKIFEINYCFYNKYYDLLEVE